MCGMHERLALGQMWAFESGILLSCAALYTGLQVCLRWWGGGVSLQDQDPLILFSRAESSDLKVPTCLTTLSMTRTDA